MRRVFHATLFVFAWLCGSISSRAESPPLQFGVAKIDITPDRPLRLTGYSNRNRPFEGVDAPLFVRSLAIRDSAGNLTVWSVVDLLGVSGDMRNAVLSKVADLKLSPERFTLCATHTHTGPHVRGVAPNIFAPRMETAELEAMNVFTDEVIAKTAKSIHQAVTDLKPSRMYLGWSQADFAVNRRFLKDGKWTGFGVQADGPTDHRVPVLHIKSAEGRTRAIVFDYACHATTLGGEYNRLSGDWPGFAAAELESIHPDAVALAMIGCGADANPEPRGSLDLAKRHGHAIVEAVKRALDSELQEINSSPASTYGFAGLAPVRPTAAEFTLRLANSNGHIRQHAQDMLDVLRDYGRIPETYPCPIQIHRFGDQLTMIFLGGEVVVDYDIRLRKELGNTIPDKRLWITAYANDVFAYVASERMRKEGGYEFDFSMYFYDQPGPWETGTENLLIGRVHDLLRQPGGEGNLAPLDALKSLVVADGFEVQLVAAEPLIADPVNIAFGPDGRLWVAEMGDYPEGPDGQGTPGGCVRYLEDTDNDGVFDKSTVFVKDIKYTTGVHPWRNGVIVSSTPEIFYAERSKGQGEADVHKTLISHFAVGNPQHVVNGFSMGLDNWLYFNGDDLGDVKPATGKKMIPLRGRDGRFRPDTGEVEAVSGVTQHVRCRNDWGDWFGGANPCPFWHFVLDDRYTRRNRYVVTPRPWQDLYEGFYAQVFPKSRIVDRFNDLFTAGRFTSACSPSPYRDVLLGDEDYIFACEPVHNLVHRAVAVREGLEFHAHRLPSEQQSEFLASTDPWFRPVRVITGPDGAIYVADMYRMVIEHPQWIPDAWKARLDLRAGHDKGRIYRVFLKGERPSGPMLPRLVDETPEQLVGRLESANGWQRDMAQQLLITSGQKAAVPLVRRVATKSKNPKGRLNALGTLLGLGELKASDVSDALADQHPAVRSFACVLAEPFLAMASDLAHAVAKLADDPEITVRFQAANSLGQWKDPAAATALAKIALHDIENEWVRTAVLTASVHYPEVVLRGVLADGGHSAGRSALIDGLLATTVGFFGEDGLQRVLAEIMPADGGEIEPWHLDATAGLLDSLDRRGMSLASWAKHSGKNSPLLTRVERTMARARQTAVSEDAKLADRVGSVRLLARGPSSIDDDRALLAKFIQPNQPIEVQSAAVAELGRLKSHEVPGLLLSAWRSFGPSVRAEAVSVLLDRPEWTLALLAAMETGTVQPSELDVPHRHELVDHSNAEIKNRASKLFDTGSNVSRKEVLAANQSALTLPGDAVRGRELFTKHCSACHRFNGVGNDVGANLETLQDRSPGNLLIAVLDPNRAVEAKFVNYTVQTTDGRVLAGMIVNETSGSITLARPDGKIEKVLRVDIEQLASAGKSFMPEGFEKDINPQQLADLFVFLAKVEKAALK